MREHDKAKERAGAEGSGAYAPDQTQVAAGVQQRRMATANAYNQAHPEQVAEFNRLTKNACGGGTYVDFQKVWGWQSSRGLVLDGKIGPSTLAAAKKEAPKKEPKDGEETGAATLAVHAEPEAEKEEKENAFAADGDPAEATRPEQKLENPDLMNQITDGAKGQEQHEKKDETVKQGGKGVSGAMKGADMVGLVPGAGDWAQIAETPYVLEMLHKGDVEGAVEYLVIKYGSKFGKPVILAALKAAAERLGLTRTVALLEKLATPAAGVALGALTALVKWTWDGFKAIDKAHKGGDRDSRIAIYSAAFADAFLFGQGAGDASGCVTPEQKEAHELGDRDGAATAGATGEQAAEIGKALVDKHGGARGARQAIINALFEHAGIGGVKL